MRKFITAFVSSLIFASSACAAIPSTNTSEVIDSKTLEKEYEQIVASGSYTMLDANDNVINDYVFEPIRVIGEDNGVPISMLFVTDCSFVYKMCISYEVENPVGVHFKKN